MSEKFEQHRVWYKLEGASKRAVERSIEIQRSGEKADKEELKTLARTLGYYHPVAQYGKDRRGKIFGYAVYPSVFGSPYQNKKEFYMYCPVGRSKNSEQDHFVPEGGIKLESDKEKNLEQGVFAPWGGSLPIIEFPQVPLRIEDTTPPPPAL